MNIKSWIGFTTLVVLVTLSCSTGKKALQKGDYFAAVVKATDRLKTDPDNKKATKVLKDGYLLAIEWSQEEMDMIMSSNSAFKWEQAINLMNQVNHLSEAIRSTPAARKIIGNPKTYTSALNMAVEKAAEERYLAGNKELDFNSRESAKMAYEHFAVADEFIPDYKNTLELMEKAKKIATINVVVEAIPVHSQRHRLSGEFFYDQVHKYLNNQFPSDGFVNFYSPYQAEKENLKTPDLILDMEFFDFSVGNLTHSEKEVELKKRVQVESKDTTRVQYKTYTAKFKSFIDQVDSGGRLRVRIAEPATDKILFDDLIPGTFTWVNEYAIFAGDKEALDKDQLALVKNKALPLPPEQDLFIEFTKPIYNQLTTKLNRFFRKYN